MGSCHTKRHSIQSKVRFPKLQVTAYKPCNARYTLHLPGLEDWFPSLSDKESIMVTDQRDQSYFELKIPAVYIFHLHWICQEASPTGDRRKNAQKRSTWLCQVLDAFVDEVCSVGDTSRWRSGVLTPVLVRALHGVDDFKKQEISNVASVQSMLPGKLTMQHWKNFYFTYDVVAPSHRKRWLYQKQISAIVTHSWDDEELPTKESKGTKCC